MFPSLYEGFGLPPLEAGLIGVPAICSRRPAMDETLEGCAMFAEPHDPAEWADKMNSMRLDASLRRDLAKKALDRAKEFTWENSVSAIGDVLVSEARYLNV